MVTATVIYVFCPARNKKFIVLTLLLIIADNSVAIRTRHSRHTTRRKFVNYIEDGCYHFDIHLKLNHAEDGGSMFLRNTATHYLTQCHNREDHCLINTYCENMKYGDHCGRRWRVQYSIPVTKVAVNVLNWLFRVAVKPGGIHAVEVQHLNF